MLTGEKVGRAVGRWWDRLPPQEHPIWKIVHSSVALAGLGFITFHMAAEGIDGHGAAGAATGSALTLLVKSIFGGKG